MLPSWSVMVMIVLLNEDLMCADPVGDVLALAPLGTSTAGAGLAMLAFPLLFSYFRAFFLPATVFFGPLRVRALVRVR